MMTAVLYKSYPAPEVNRAEMIRYMGAKTLSEEQEKILDDCLNEILPRLSYKVCWREVDITNDGESVGFEFSKVDSRGLARNLDGCDKAVVFAATIGIEMDRAIAKYSRISPVKGLMMQAIGAERIESLCDTFNLEISDNAKFEGKFLRPRFSPGYGDFPLSFQKEIFASLDCGRKIGLALNESFLMSPSKSVTAVIGLSGCLKKYHKEKCSACDKADCTFRTL